MGRKPVSRPSNPIDGRPMLKMKELVEATGISKATILYYVAEQLLPQPVKTSPNVAYYSSSMVERVHLIRQLQSQHRFSLAQIRTILQERDLLDRKAFCRACGLTKEQVQTAVDLKLLIPESGNRFDVTDVKAGKRLKINLGMGLSFEDLVFYAQLGEQIVAHEMKLRKRLIRSMSHDEALNTTLKLTQGARFFREYIIERIFQQQALRQPLNLADE